MNTSICTTCNKPANAGYARIRAGVLEEMCCDPCHGPYLVPISGRAARFAAFHGKRKARAYMQARSAA